jgi:dTDP-4-dehydrorhamnose 3,5-epimerase
MKVLQTKLPEVSIFEPQVFKDSRGFFMEMYNEKRYLDAGVTEKFVQDNISTSSGPVLRGLHYQLKNPQGKLVSVLHGKVFDVVVDLRQGSPHFGQWIGTELSAENKWQIYVPPGFAHGFCTLSADVVFHYKCTDYYNPQDEYGVQWSDTDLKIDWPISETPRISPKDAVLPVLKDIAPHHFPTYHP